MYDPGTLFTDPLLTSFSIGYKPQQLHGERLMPFVETTSPSGRYRVFDRSAWLMYYDRREPGTVANEIAGRKWSEDTYKTKEHSLQAAVADEEEQFLNSQGGLANAAFGGPLQIDPEEDATAAVTTAILLRHEKLVADTVRNVANYPGGSTITLAAADQWDNYAGATSNPIDVLRAGVQKVDDLIGRPPNRLAIPRQALGWLENHPDIVARFINFSLTDPQAWIKLIGLPEDAQIILTSSKYNAANHIDAAEAITSLWGKDVWLGYVEDEANLETLTFGKTFAVPYPDGTIGPVDRWREEGRKSDLVRKSMRYDVKVTSGAAGYLIKTAFSATAWVN
jgi:hypothetical protein